MTLSLEDPVWMSLVAAAMAVALGLIAMSEGRGIMPSRRGRIIRWQYRLLRWEGSTYHCGKPYAIVDTELGIDFNKLRSVLLKKIVVVVNGPERGVRGTMLAAKI